ncbi:D-alanyl-D-alanine carboxypeptidase/D-alanyl-D-alanine-endopeptidase [Janibacter sp. GXQ6167]|uniref:D-alanyl-D-alanine carboxypeptidase/D-alanyl-D-alanine endopeptidase n=1 Tax=Janibacter sp. GXQ6167 TaxID=3240791 RepID=UPI003525BC7A
MRRAVAVLCAFALVIGGYLVADIYDIAPGWLTLSERELDPAEGPVPHLEADEAVLTPVSTDTPVPTKEGITSSLKEEVTDPALGKSVGFIVRDALTGEELFTKDADAPRIPASTAKILAGATVSQTLDLAQTMSTRVVAGTSPNDLILVAAGDTLLAEGKGSATSVEGRAGLGDLADEVARVLKDRGVTGTLRLRLDATYAAGPRYAPTWNMDDVAAGYTQGVSMIGLAKDRPQPFAPSPQFPERAVLTSFAAALKKAGVATEVVDTETSWTKAAPADAEVLGDVESAPIGDVLAYALDHSDNAMTENLVRQAMVSKGKGTSFADATAFVTETLTDAGIDMSDVTLKDTSGLSKGQKIPARVISDVMQLGVTGPAPTMRGVLADLPVAGVTGTLTERFHADDSKAAAGIARAKTGTLTGTSGLAGTTVTADGRLLTYVLLADRVPSTTGTLGARAALDRIVGDLTSCGCR